MKKILPYFFLDGVKLAFGNRSYQKVVGNVHNLKMWIYFKLVLIMENLVELKKEELQKVEGGVAPFFAFLYGVVVGISIMEKFFG